MNSKDIDLDQSIKEAAYFAWLNAGKPSGKDIDFWCLAEREIVGATIDEAYDSLKCQHLVHIIRPDGQEVCNHCGNLVLNEYFSLSV